MQSIIREDQKVMVSEFNGSNDILNSKLDKPMNALKSHQAERMTILKPREVELFETITKALVEMVAGDSRMEELELYSRRNCVQIQSIPVELPVES